MPTTVSPKTETPKLSATEQKLLRQIQAQIKPQPSWVKFLSSTCCGFAW